MALRSHNNDMASDELQLLEAIYEVLSASHEPADPSVSDASDDLPLAVKAIWTSRPEDALRYIYEKFYAFPLSELPGMWLRAYEEVAWKAAAKVVQTRLEVCRKDKSNGKHSDLANFDGDMPKRDCGWIEEAVQILDKAIIMTGATKRFGAINQVLELIAQFLDSHEEDLDRSKHPPSKRRRLDVMTGQAPGSMMPSAWPSRPLRHPKIRNAIKAFENPSFEWFQNHLNDSNPEIPSKVGPMPIVIKNSISHWPALDPESPRRNWNNPQNIMRATLGGRRLAPIETGTSYMDDDFGQKIITIREFVAEYMLSSFDSGDEHRGKDMAYLAQHDLLHQIPRLRSDVGIPDYCYAHPSSADGREEDQNEPAEPLMNAWFGPAGTITPLHRDNYHNIFAQVVGHKYIRLYRPSQASMLYPADVDENGISIANTSRVDVGQAMKLLEGWDWDGDCAVDGSSKEAEAALLRFDERFPDFRKAEYLETVLGPGDCLYVPYGWWHYVRSLSVSFSVSFWWR